MTYKGYTIQKLYETVKMVGFVVSWQVVVSKLCIKLSKYR